MALRTNQQIFDEVFGAMDDITIKVPSGRDPPAVGRPYVHEGTKYRVKAVRNTADGYTIVLE